MAKATEKLWLKQLFQKAEGAIVYAKKMLQMDVATIKQIGEITGLSQRKFRELKAQI